MCIHPTPGLPKAMWKKVQIKLAKKPILAHSLPSDEEKSVPHSTRNSHKQYETFWFH